MDEECETVARQHDVWLARQIPTMEPEAQTVPVQESPHVDFWPRIARSDPLHIELALRRREDIGHPYVRPQLRLPRRRVDVTRVTVSAMASRTPVARSGVQPAT